MVEQRRSQCRRHMRHCGHFSKTKTIQDDQLWPVVPTRIEYRRLLPLAGLRAFEIPKAVAAPLASDPLTGTKPSGRERDTIIVPAKKDGFEETFLGEDCWYAIRIAGGMLDKIKYIAAYQTQPVSAITHYAPVSRIEPYGEGGKYKVVFSESAKPIGPIPYGDALPGAMQSPRYTSFARLQKAQRLTDVLGTN